MPSNSNWLVKPVLTCVLLLLFHSVFSQKTVTGKILSKTGNQPISGASIRIKGTNTGTQTSDQGTFSLIIPKNNSVLQISVVGFENIEVPVNGRASVGTVSLNATSSTLNEIVVTGYTTQRKKDITGSVSVVSAKELVANPGSNVESLLQGKASGVTVGTSGVPGAGASIRIVVLPLFNKMNLYTLLTELALVLLPILTQTILNRYRYLKMLLLLPPMALLPQMV